jgi:hypothetical protein
MQFEVEIMMKFGLCKWLKYIDLFWFDLGNKKDLALPTLI